MSFNLIEMVKGYFTNEFTNQAASSLGENSSGVSKALSAIIPAGLAGILQKVTSSSSGANDILSMAKGAIGNISGGVPNVAVDSLHSDDNNIVSNLFGSNKSGVVSAISRFAGLKDSSISSLLSMGLPAIMGILGKHADENNLTASGLSGLLTSQKDNIMQAMPSGLSSIGSLLGLGSMGAAASSMVSNVKTGISDTARSTQNVVDKPKGNKWLIPVIIIIVGLALLWFLSKGCNETKSNNAVITDTSTTLVVPNQEAPAVEMPTSTESIKVKLPNGKELDAYRGGIEDQLVTFLSGDWKSMSDNDLKQKWFNFDNLNFNTGTATLVADSEKQLDNIAEILKAFPDAKIKIGGYTDVTGDAAANKKLSQDRANSAKNGLEKRGVGKQVTGAEGYGSEFAKAASTAPDSERALDRHVSLSVRK
ncbi:MAG: OmpA family protein [Ferruginibacter sp.]